MGETVFPPGLNWVFPMIASTRGDGSLLYGSTCDVVILERTESGGVRPSIISDAHCDRITCVVCHPSNNPEEVQDLFLTAGDDGFVKVWSLAALKPLKCHNSHLRDKETAGTFVCAHWSPRDPRYIVSAAANDTVVRWDLSSNETLRFSFPELRPTVIQCSFHDENVVAIGSDTKQVYVVDLRGKGGVVRKLRGHSMPIRSVSWSPEDSSPSGDHFLASSSDESGVFVWRLPAGSVVDKIPLPRSSLSGDARRSRGGADVAVAPVPILWATPNVLYAGTKFGELIQFDASLFAARKKEPLPDKTAMLKRWKLRAACHSNMVMTLIGMQRRGGCLANASSLIWTVGKDTTMAAVAEDPGGAPGTVIQLSSLNGHPYYATVSPHDPNKMAVCAGDKKIRLWTVTKASGYCQWHQWRNLSGRMYSLAWHPSREGILACGTAEGDVGVFDVFHSLRSPTILRRKHGGVVYKLAWGPPFSPGVDVDGDASNDFALFSVGDGQVLQRNAEKADEEPLKLADLVNFPHEDLLDICWKPDFALLAVGCRDGSLCLLRPPNPVVLHVLNDLGKNLQSVSWHPAATTADADSSAFRGYFTFGSRDSADTSVRVWNCVDDDDGGGGGESLKVAKVVDLVGHESYVQFVSWNPHVAGRLVSSSFDGSVRIWNVETGSALASFCLGARLPLFCMWSPVDPDVLISGVANRIMVSWKMSAFADDGAVIKQRFASSGKKKKKQNLTLKAVKVEGSSPERASLVERVESKRRRTRKEKEETEEKEEEEGAWLASARVGDADSLSALYELLKEGNATEDASLERHDEWNNWLDEEGEAHAKANRWSQHRELSLIRGRVRDAVEDGIRSGRVDEFLVAAAPSVSVDLWRRACRALSKSLAEQGMHRKAAAYLVAVDDVTEAAELLVAADLRDEALLVLAQHRPSDAELAWKILSNGKKPIRKRWLYRFCKRFISAKDFSVVSRLLATKNDAEHLSLAACADKRGGHVDRELEHATAALILAMEKANWDLAARICVDHSNFKELSMLRETCRFLHELDSGDAELETDLTTDLTKVLEGKEVGDLSSSYSSLLYDHDEKALYMDKNKLFVALSREIALSCCAVDEDVRMTHVVRALNAASRFVAVVDVRPLYKLCTWLRGYSSGFANESCSRPKIRSARAFFGLGLVEHVDSREFVAAEEEEEEELKRHATLVRDLAEDLLDEEAFAYHANQIAMKSLRKRIADARNVVVRGEEEATSAATDVRDREDANMADVEEMERKMAALAAEATVFEDTRVLAPNPAVVYCLLKRTCEMFAARGVDAELIRDVEEKWRKLQEK